MPVIRRALVILATLVVAVGISFMFETPTTAISTHSTEQVGVAQSGQGTSALRLCFATQKCVPANHPGSSGTVAPVLAYGFIGVVAVVLASRRRSRRRLPWHPAPFKFFPAIFRPPIAS